MVEDVGYGISYTFVLNDQYTPVIDQMTSGTMRLRDSVREVTKSKQEANIQWMTEMMAIMSIYSGMRRIVLTLNELGVISEEDARRFQKLNAAIGLVVGTFQLFRGAIKILQTINALERSHAIILTFKTALKSPAGAAMALAAVGITAFAAGALWESTKKTSKQETNITFQPYGTPETREVARGTVEVLGAY